MKRLRLLLTLLLPVLLLLPTSGTSAPRGEEAPWREGGWAGAFAVSHCRRSPISHAVASLALSSASAERHRSLCSEYSQALNLFGYALSTTWNRFWLNRSSSFERLF